MVLIISSFSTCRSLRSHHFPQSESILYAFLDFLVLLHPPPTPPPPSTASPSALLLLLSLNLSSPLLPFPSSAPTSNKAKSRNKLQPISQHHHTPSTYLPHLPNSIKQKYYSQLKKLAGIYPVPVGLSRYQIEFPFTVMPVV